MSLKIGVWKMNQNGVEATLNINVLDPETGVVSLASPVFAQQPGAGQAALGLWDETSRTISFWGPLTVEHGAPRSPRFYKGFLFSTPATPTPGQDVVWTLAGFVQVLDLGAAQEMGGNARRNVFGWFAQITEVG